MKVYALRNTETRTLIAVFKTKKAAKEFAEEAEIDSYEYEIVKEDQDDLIAKGILHPAYAVEN